MSITPLMCPDPVISTITQPIPFDLNMLTAASMSKDAKDLIPALDPANWTCGYLAEEGGRVGYGVPMGRQEKAHFALIKLTGVAAIWF